MRFVRSWWFVPAVIVATLIPQKVLESRYDATGHAAGHLGSATAIFPMVALFAIVLWATPGAWRSVGVWVGGAIMAAGLAGVLVGNLRVVDAIGPRNLSDDQAGSLGHALDGFDSGHDLAQLAWLAVLGSLVLIWVLAARRSIPRSLAIGASVASVVFPPWILPGAGLAVLAVGQCVRRARRPRQPVNDGVAATGPVVGGGSPGGSVVGGGGGGSSSRKTASTAPMSHSAVPLSSPSIGRAESR
jgi:hypothetical protein